MGSPFLYRNFRMGLCVPSHCQLYDMQRMSQKVAETVQMDIQIKECYVEKPLTLENIHIALICAVAALLLFCVWGTILEYNNKGSLSSKNTKSRAIMCFSIISNYKQLTSPPTKSETLSIVNGLKFMAISWVMLGHNYSWTNFSLTRRPKLLTSVFTKLEFGPVLNSWLAVEPFFLINGLLTGYSVLQTLSLSKGKINILAYILRRYFRILLLFLLIVGLAFAMPLASSGPFWYSVVDHELNNCRKNWWLSILFVSNWISYNDICISASSWFISTDLQIHIVSIIPLFLLYRFPRFGLFFVFCVILGSTIIVAFVTYKNDLFPIIQVVSSNYQKTLSTIDLVHLLPFTHAGSYYIGVLLGAAFLKWKTVKINPVCSFFGWSISAFLILISLYGSHGCNIGTPYYSVLVAVFSSLHRTTFSLGLAWVIFVCTTGNGGFVNSLLSSPLLVVGGRLTFMTFLTHSLVFWTRSASARERMLISHYNLIYEYIGNVVLTLIMAALSHLLLEAPITNLDQLLFPSKESQKEQETNCPENNKVQNQQVFSATYDPWCKKHDESPYQQRWRDLLAAGSPVIARESAANLRTVIHVEHTSR